MYNEVNDTYAHDNKSRDKVQGYEYIRISSDLGSLDLLNRFSVNGWRVVIGNEKFLLLERPLS